MISSTKPILSSVISLSAHDSIFVSDEETAVTIVIIRIATEDESLFNAAPNFETAITIGGSLDDSTAIKENEAAIKHKPYDWSRQDLCHMEIVLTEFKSHLIRRAVFPLTVQKYLKDLRQFFREMNIVTVDSINRKVIDDWILVLRMRSLTTGTVANHLWAIKAFLKFLEEDKGICFYKFDIRIPTVKSPEKIEYLEIEELEKLYSTINISKIQGLRLRTLIEVMVNTGLRPTEALSLKKDDIKPNTDTLHIVGKGGKRREIYYKDNVIYWIRAYLSERKDEHPALFVTHHRKNNTAKPLSLRNAEFIFQEALKKSGIDKRVVLHTLRHTYATLLMANGCPPDYIAQLLGHSKVETTRKYYAAVRQKHAKAAHFRFLPFGQKINYEMVAPTPLQLSPVEVPSRIR